MVWLKWLVSYSTIWWLTRADRRGHWFVYGGKWSLGARVWCDHNASCWHGFSCPGTYICHLTNACNHFVDAVCDHWLNWLLLAGPHIWGAPGTTDRCSSDVAHRTIICGCSGARGLTRLLPLSIWSKWWLQQSASIISISVFWQDTVGYTYIQAGNQALVLVPCQRHTEREEAINFYVYVIMYCTS